MLIMQVILTYPWCVALIQMRRAWGRGSLGPERFRLLKFVIESTSTYLLNKTVPLPNLFIVISFKFIVWTQLCLSTKADFCFAYVLINCQSETFEHSVSLSCSWMIDVGRSDRLSVTLLLTALRWDGQFPWRLLRLGTFSCTRKANPD